MFAITTIAVLLGSQSVHNWDNTPNQHWIGSDWHANRLQDWHVQNNRVICSEVTRRLPMRTLHLLTATTDGEFTAQVTTGTVDPNLQSAKNAWSGFLIGAGNDEIDYRLTALTHHVPASDGGLIAGVDHFGMVFLRDNSIPVGSTSLWSINTKITDAEVPLIEPDQFQGDGFTDGKRTAVIIQLSITSQSSRSLQDNTLCVQISATDSISGETISTASYSDIDKSLLDGNIALMSHHGPKTATSGHWFDDFSLTGSGVIEHPERAFGPVLCSLYTQSNNVLKLTAQFPPLDGPCQAIFSYLNKTAQVPIDTDSWTATFRVSNWNPREETPYTIALLGDDRTYEGVIRAEPNLDQPLSIAALTCHKTYTGNLQWNHNGLWFPQNGIVDAVEASDPDLLYFSGDQIYEGDLTPARQTTEEAYILDYLYKWSHWCWAFGDLTRNRPCVSIPDDHDVYHGNLWGAGERDAQQVEGLSKQDSGGYKRSARFVNAVHRTQTSHLPDPVDPKLDAQGNTVYFTRLRYGGLDIAILGDRQFKESPAIACPEGNVYNGWFRAEDFDIKTQTDKDVPLLGSRQEQFLDAWSTNWLEDDWLKFVFSQTPFVCLQTLPAGTTGGHQASLTIYPDGEHAPNDVPVADADSNGWPQSARNRTLRMFRKANAIHICGDQHLGSVAKYGIDSHSDGTYVFCTPAIANTWPRRWMPRDLPITGDHEDGFGNLVTVLAVSNPHISGHEPAALHDRAPGWGLLVCNPAKRNVKINAWPRWAQPNAPDSDQYEGWPIMIEKAGKKKQL